MRSVHLLVPCLPFPRALGKKKNFFSAGYICIDNIFRSRGMRRSFTSVPFGTPDHDRVLMLIQAERTSYLINYVSLLERTANNIVRADIPTLI